MGLRIHEPVLLSFSAPGSMLRKRFHSCRFEYGDRTSNSRSKTNILAHGTNFILEAQGHGGMKQLPTSRPPNQLKRLTLWTSDTLFIASSQAISFIYTSREVDTVFDSGFFAETRGHRVLEPWSNHSRRSKGCGCLHRHRL